MGYFKEIYILEDLIDRLVLSSNLIYDNKLHDRIIGLINSLVERISKDALLTDDEKYILIEQITSLLAYASLEVEF